MSVRRVMGTEVEYGISVQGQPSANPMVASSQIVNAYATSTQRRDGRAGTSRRSHRCATPAASTCPAGGRRQPAHRRGPRPRQRDPDQRSPALCRPRAPGVLLARGHVAARRGAVGEGRRAGDARRLADGGQAPGSTPILLYKNNTDNKGASYGAHENYLMRRSTPFAEIVRHLTPSSCRRQVVCGAGRVGIGQDGRDTTPELGSRSASAPTTSRWRSVSRRR